jgi:hypothetical protein
MTRIVNFKGGEKLDVDPLDGHRLLQKFKSRRAV